jgi:ParB family chromosome partitioning protein
MEIVMTYIQCTPTQPQLIAVSRLGKSPLNARRTNVTMGMEELKASLLAHGLLQNLVVTDTGDGSYRVIAGGRRLEAIHSLQAEGKLPEDFAVPCQITTEEQAPEMSLAENMVRLAMHPADQFEAFAALIDHGASAEDVATRFGIEESLVQKRMKLARVSPQLLAEYRGEGLTLECLMAFTVADDHRRQLNVFKSLQDWQKDDPSAIRAALTEKMVEGSDKLALFVGLDVYQAAGGSIRADLFGDEIYLEKPSLLNKLAEKKLDGLRHELEAEGWGWIEINPERDWNLVSKCQRLKPRLIDAPSEWLDLKSTLDAELQEIEQALDDTESDELIDKQEAAQKRLDEVEEKLAAFVGFDADHKTLADKGLVRPEQRKQLAKLLGADGEPGKAKPKHALPESLRRDLAAGRLQVAQIAIAQHPAIALDLLVFQAASELLGQRPVSDGPDVKYSRSRTKPCGKQESTTAAFALATIEQALPADWLKATSDAARFEAFRSLPEAAKLELLAYVVALSLKPKLAPAEGENATAYDAALTLTATSVAEYWRPTKSNFLGRITRDQLLAVSRDVLGEPWAQSRFGEKKTLLVEQLDRAFSDPEKLGRTSEQVEKLKSWLPVGMSFEAVPAVKPAKAKKTKLAA